MKKELLVTAIKNGTVIDHITAGSAMRIVSLLKLAGDKRQVTLGLNLPSASMGYKDLIKVEDRVVTKEESALIALFAPKASINIIEDFHCTSKFSVSMPKEVRGVISCHNARCVTNHEPVATHFRVGHFGKRVELECQYCRSTHDA